MKTLLLILLALTITTLNLKAEKLQGQANLDSLLAELPKVKGDTNEVNLLARISFSFYSIDPDKGIEYGLKGVKLAKKINWKKGEARIYNSIGTSYRIKSNYPKALDYHSKALKIHEELNNKDGIADNLVNMGIIYRNQSNYPKALDYYSKALEIHEELENKKGIANILGNMGIIYANQSDYPKALEYFGNALKIVEEFGDKDEIARHLGNMGNIYQFQSDYPKALEYIGKALKLYEEMRNKVGMAINLGSMGNIYNLQSDYPNALLHLGKALKIFGEMRNKNGMAICLGNIANIYNIQSNYPKALEYYGKSLKIVKEIGNKESVARVLGNMGSLYLAISKDSVSISPDELNDFISLDKEINLNKAIEYHEKSIKMYEEIGEIKDRSNNLKTLAKAYELKGDISKSYNAFKEHIKLKDSVFNQEKNNQIAAIEKAREDDVNRIQIEKQKVQLASQESEKMFIIYSGIGIVAFVVAILILIAYQRKKSDKLLYNVLPISIAKRLKKKEHPISDHFDQASIIFIDIVGFTAMSKDSDPTDIVKALNKVFTHYDSIANKHGLEKIKTIGDCYMAAAGIPVIQKDNTLRAARMAIEVRDYMIDYYTDHGFKLDVRIGLDCGPVVAGVIGEKKFIYDMWSDAVNTASRMESSSIAGQVHVSERFKEAVNEYEQFDYVERGEIEIKGKGKMKTFFMGSRVTTSL